MPEDLGYAYFVRTIRKLVGIDLDSYRPGQMRRRLDSLVQRVGSKDYMEYAKLLERDSSRIQEFRDFFTINVTEFFRDADRFRCLERQVLPGLVEGRSSLRVWSAACSTGAEPYSVAMLLRELAPRGGHKILATDVDRTIISRARDGKRYLAQDVRNVTPERLQRFFARAADSQSWSIKPEVQQLVEFREHNLLDQAPGGNFDLILCRNVVIYFTDEAKRDLYDRLVGALRPGGVLFVGGTEIVPGAIGLGLSTAGPSFYRKGSEVGVPSRLARVGGLR